MNQYFFFLCASIIINITLLSFFFHEKLNTKKPAVQTIESKKVDEKIYKVAIIAQSTNVFSERSKQGIIDTLKKNNSFLYEFTSYVSPRVGDRTMIRSMIEDALIKKHDVLIPIGALCSQMAKAVSIKRNDFTPIVFCGVKDPVSNNLMESEESSGNHITGVTGVGRDYKHQIDILLTLKPSIKNVLVVYCPSTTGILEQDKNLIASLLEKHGVSTHTVEIFNTNEIIQKVASSMPGMDALITLRDPMTMGAAETLTKLCNKYKVTFFTCHLDAVNEGAALAYGMPEYDYGVRTIIIEPTNLNYKYYFTNL